MLISLMVVIISLYCIPCVCVCVKSLRLCPTLGDPMDCNLPGSSVHGIPQPRILEWVAMPSSRDLPDPGIKAASLSSPALAGRFFTTSATGEAPSVAFQFRQSSRSVVSDSLQPHGLQHARPPCPSPTPRVHSNPCPLSQ